MARILPHVQFHHNMEFHTTLSSLKIMGTQTTAKHSPTLRSGCCEECARKVLAEVPSAGRAAAQKLGNAGHVLEVYTHKGKVSE